MQTRTYPRQCHFYRSGTGHHKITRARYCVYDIRFCVPFLTEDARNTDSYGAYIPRGGVAARISTAAAFRKNLPAGSSACSRTREVAKADPPTTPAIVPPLPIAAKKMRTCLAMCMSRVLIHLGPTACGRNEHLGQGGEDEHHEVPSRRARCDARRKVLS